MKQGRVRFWEIRGLIYSAAQRHGVPPAYITAHTRIPAADQARMELFRLLVGRCRIPRYKVAEIFGRDRRRLSKSAIGV